MKKLHKMTAGIILGTAAAGLAATAAGAASAVTFDPALLQMVDQTIMKMREETIKEQFAKMPLKERMPNTMVASMSQYAATAYRTAIQPYAVQGMMSQIRPYEFPAKFRGTMMPSMVPILSSQIKEQQLRFMQDGIPGNQAFPSVPGAQTGK